MVGNRCYYCHSEDKQVEAGGVWHCPNPYCCGPGAFHVRIDRGYHDKHGVQTPDQLHCMIRDCTSDTTLDATVREYSLSRLIHRASAARADAPGILGILDGPVLGRLTEPVHLLVPPQADLPPELL